MRLVHTADWHLGHAMAGHSRASEHAQFLSWLTETLERDAVDGLIMCGDVFDHGHPAAAAQRQLYTFLADVRRRLPSLAIVFIGGNHDTAARLDAPGPVLDAVGVTMIGGLPRDNGNVCIDRCVVPLRCGTDVEVAAIAVPFLRAPDLSLLSSGERVVVDGTRVVVERAVERARALYPGVPIVALAHCELEGARLSLSSERPLFGGKHALPADLFHDAGVDYAALGHLHLAQFLGTDGRARYSGSPIPMSMAERDYAHQVVVVDVEPARVAVTKRLVPRTVDLIRIPDDALGVGTRKAAPLDEVLDRLRALDVPDRPVDARPFLEVRVRLDRPVPDLRAQIDAALTGKAVRLVRVERERDGDGLALADMTAGAEASVALADLSPQSVLRALYGRHYQDPLPPALSDAFARLVDDDARARIDPSADGATGEVV